MIYNIVIIILLLLYAVKNYRSNQKKDVVIISYIQNFSGFGNKMAGIISSLALSIISRKILNSINRLFIYMNSMWME